MPSDAAEASGPTTRAGAAGTLIEVDDLNQVGYVSLLANAPIGALQNSLDDLTYWNGQFVDELVNRNAQNPFVEEGQIDEMVSTLRDVLATIE